jgi:transposase
MKLSTKQWERLAPFFPKRKRRKDGKGRPAVEPREVLEGVLWVLKTGARWKDLPERYPPYQTCHRYFQQWVKIKLMEKILRELIEDLLQRGKINLAETFIDATFVKAKKGAKKLGKPSLERVPSSWQSSTITLFLSPYPLKVLHRMRVNLLRQRFGPAIRKTFLTELSETKLTILIHSMNVFEDDLESNLLLPTSQIGKNELKMDELLEDTRTGGKWSDSLRGSRLSEE